MAGLNPSPRFRDLDDQRFWRATMPGVETGHYGALEDLARNRVNLNKVITYWPDRLKVAGSLVTNQVRAYDLLRMFGREGCPTPLGVAFAEYGRIAKTEHLLPVVDPVDDTYRRQMNRQLTVQESRHKLARDVCHGKRGSIHQAYHDGMEDHLDALGLVLYAIVLWTTMYIDAAVAQLRAGEVRRFGPCPELVHELLVIAVDDVAPEATLGDQLCPCEPSDGRVQGRPSQKAFCGGAYFLAGQRAQARGLRKENDPLGAVSLIALARECRTRQFRGDWLADLRPDLERVVAVVGACAPYGREAPKVERADGQGRVAWTKPLFSTELKFVVGYMATACGLAVAALAGMRHRELGNVLGRYSFTASQPGGGSQPLRAPDPVGLDEESGN